MPDGACETCGRKWTRWHIIRLEKINVEPRHFAWDSGKYMGWCWRLLIGFWIVSLRAEQLATGKQIQFHIGQFYPKDWLVRGLRIR